MSSTIQVYLASGSPRRQELLTQLGYQFERAVVDVEECHQAGETPEQYVQRLAKDKALAGVAVTDGHTPVIGSILLLWLMIQSLKSPLILMMQNGCWSYYRVVNTKL